MGFSSLIVLAITFALDYLPVLACGTDDAPMIKEHTNAMYASCLATCLTRQANARKRDNGLSSRRRRRGGKAAKEAKEVMAASGATRAARRGEARSGLGKMKMARL